MLALGADMLVELCFVKEQLWLQTWAIVMDHVCCRKGQKHRDTCPFMFLETYSESDASEYHGICSRGES